MHGLGEQAAAHLAACYRRPTLPLPALSRVACADAIRQAVPAGLFAELAVPSQLRQALGLNSVGDRLRRADAPRQGPALDVSVLAVGASTTAPLAMGEQSRAQQQGDCLFAPLAAARALADAGTPRAAARCCPLTLGARNPPALVSPLPILRLKDFALKA